MDHEANIPPVPPERLIFVTDEERLEFERARESMRATREQVEARFPPIYGRSQAMDGLGLAAALNASPPVQPFYTRMADIEEQATAELLNIIPNPAARWSIAATGDTAGSPVYAGWFDDPEPPTPPEPLDAPVPPMVYQHVGLDPAVNLYLDQLQAARGRPLTTTERGFFHGVTSRQEINKIFFGLPNASVTPTMPEAQDPLAPPALAQPPPDPLCDMDRLSQTLNRALKAQRSQMVKQWTEELIYRRRNAIQAASKWEDELKHARSAQIKLESIENTEMNAKTIIAATDGNPFWQMSRTDAVGGFVYWRSGDVIIVDKNKESGTNMVVNLGKLELRWNIQNANIRVFPLEKNLKFDNYYHPHIGADGCVCLGNAADTVSKALLEYRLNDVLILIQSLLQTYNAESPYIGLQHFWAQQNPEELAKGPTEHRAMGRVRMYEDRLDFSPKVLHYSEGDDNREVIECRWYQLVNIKYGCPIDDKRYLISGNNKYIEFDEDAVYEWD